MNKNIDKMESEIWAAYEPVNSKFRERAFKEWRTDGTNDDKGSLRRKKRNRKNVHERWFHTITF
jgi:ribosomal protein L19E